MHDRLRVQQHCHIEDELLDRLKRHGLGAGNDLLPRHSDLTDEGRLRSHLELPFASPGIGRMDRAPRFIIRLQKDANMKNVPASMHLHCFGGM